MAHTDGKMSSKTSSSTTAAVEDGAAFLSARLSGDEHASFRPKFNSVSEPASESEVARVFVAAQVPNAELNRIISTKPLYSHCAQIAFVESECSSEPEDWLHSMCNMGVLAVRCDCENRLKLQPFAPSRVARLWKSCQGVDGKRTLLLESSCLATYLLNFFAYLNDASLARFLGQLNVLALSLDLQRVEMTPGTATDEMKSEDDLVDQNVTHVLASVARVAKLIQKTQSKLHIHVATAIENNWLRSALVRADVATQSKAIIIHCDENVLQTQGKQTAECFFYPLSKLIGMSFNMRMDVVLRDFFLLE